MPPLYEVPALYALCVIFLFVIFRSKRRLGRLRRLKALNGKQKKAGKYILNFTVRLGNPARTMLLPFAVMLVAAGIYPSLGEQRLDIAAAAMIFPLMVIIQPLVEEIALRAMLFGFFVTKADEARQKPGRDNAAYLAVFLAGFLIQNMIFMLLHFRINLPTFISGAINSAFFLDGFGKDGERNVLPAWAAHSSHNLLVWLGQIGIMTTGWVWAVI